VYKAFQQCATELDGAAPSSRSAYGTPSLVSGVGPAFVVGSSRSGVEWVLPIFGPRETDLRSFCASANDLRFSLPTLRATLADSCADPPASASSLSRSTTTTGFGTEARAAGFPLGGFLLASPTISTATSLADVAVVAGGFFCGAGFVASGGTGSSPPQQHAIVAQKGHVPRTVVQNVA
jgi:hypothetical protein